MLTGDLRDTACAPALDAAWSLNKLAYVAYGRDVCKLALRNVFVVGVEVSHDGVV